MATENKYIEYLDKSDSGHILNLIIGMQLMQENHGKNIRMELLAKEAVKRLKKADNQDLNKLKAIISTEYPHHHLEDPAEALFTESILFHGGNYIVMPGIMHNGADILRLLLEAIYSNIDRFPKSFDTNIANGTLLMLELGQLLFDSAHLDKNMYVNDIDNLLKFPGEEIIYSIKDEDLIEICRNKKIDYRIIGNFITDTKAENFEAADANLNPLLKRPLVNFNGRYYFLLPSTQVTALIEFIFDQAKKHGCEKELLHLYFNRIGNNILNSCRKMDWQPIPNTLPELDDTLIAKEALFKFDTNRTAYLLYINNDKFNSISTETDIKEAMSLSVNLNRRISEVINYLKGQEENKEEKILSLILVGEEGGQQSMIGLGKPDECEERICFMAFDFINLVKSEKWRELGIWKFGKVYNNAAKSIQFTFTSTLDLYAIYKWKDEGFYFSDEQRETYAVIPPGDGSKLIREIKIKRNLHGALYEYDKGYGYVPVERFRDYAPIYKPTGKTDEIILLMESFQFPLWIKCNQVEKDTGSIIIKILDSICFWLDKLSGFLQEEFYGKFPNLLTIKIELATQLFDLKEYGELEQGESNIDFAAGYNGNTLTFLIPAGIQKVLVGTDNKGERILMKGLLNAFNEIPSIDLSDTFIDEIINKAMPLGPVKMVFLYNTSRNFLLDGRWLMEPYYISDAEIGVLLDNLGEIINAPIPSRIIGKTEKVKFCNSVVMALLKYLQEKIKGYDNKKLLFLLINQNESLTYDRENKRISIPAQINCFGDSQDKIDELYISEQKTTRTIIATRCLIEYLAANPASGANPIGYDELDELMVIMNEIVNYGMVSDAIHFDFDDPDIGLLPSKRIGITKSFYDSTINPFTRATTEAGIEVLLSNFEFLLNFDTGEEISDDNQFDTLFQKIDTAFTNDWGVSYSNLYKICNWFAKIAIAAEASLAEIDEEDAIQRITKELGISENEVRKGLERLSFSKQPILIHVNGYSKELSPWKYSRDLSYVRKPLIKIMDNGKTTYMFGMRQCMAAFEYIQVCLFKGKLKNAGNNITKIVGEINKNKGKEFRNHIKDLLKKNIQLTVWDFEITIEHNGHLEAEENFGDIDVMAFDSVSNTLYSIECKKTEPARNVHEMKQELDMYIGRNGQNGMIEKHVKRHQWLLENMSKVKTYLGIESQTEINLESIVVTSNIIPLTYLKSVSLSLPIISIPAFKRLFNIDNIQVAKRMELAK